MKVRILGVASSNQASPLVGRWLVAFGPCSAEEAQANFGKNPDVMYGFAPSLAKTAPMSGQPVRIETTDDPEKARDFSDAGEALSYVQQVMPKPHHERFPDGMPNRPMTAYHVEIV